MMEKKKNEGVMGMKGKKVADMGKMAGKKARNTDNSMMKPQKGMSGGNSMKPKKSSKKKPQKSGGSSANDNKNPIKYTRSLGTNVLTSISSETSTTLTVLTSAADASNAVEFTDIVSFLLYSVSGGSITCSDSLSRDWTQLASVTFNTDYKLVVFYVTGVVTCPKDTVITVSHPTCQRRVIIGDEFRHLFKPTPADQLASANNSVSSTFVTSGLTTTTAQDNELLYGVIGVNGPVTDGFTRPSNWTILHDRGTTAGDAHDVRVLTLFRTTSNQAAYEVSGTLSAARLWSAVTQTFKAQGGGASQQKD